MNSESKKEIYDLILRTVEDTIERLKNNEQTLRPFHEKLLTKNILTASSFERSFSTSFGQRTLEQLPVLVAKDKGYLAENSRRTTGLVYVSQMDEINKICEDLRNRDSKRIKNWSQEMNSIISLNEGKKTHIAVISDLWIKKNNQECFYSLKTVKPNIDQTEKAKNDMLKLKALNSNYEVYFALAYNPYGENKSDYSWNQPFTIFDMHNDPCVLIGKEYWDSIGGLGTYEELLDICSEVGVVTRKLLEEF